MLFSERTQSENGITFRKGIMLLLERNTITKKSTGWVYTRKVMNMQNEDKVLDQSN